MRSFNTIECVMKNYIQTKNELRSYLNATNATKTTANMQITEPKQANTFSC